MTKQTKEIFTHAFIGNKENKLTKFEKVINNPF